MTTTAQSIIKEVQTLLQDVAGVQWPAGELVDALNDGQREIAILRPDLMSKTQAVALVAGPKQAMPSDFAKLMEIPRNTNGAAIRQADRNMLDAFEPSWYSKTGVASIQHFTYDPKQPNVFFVYPPAAVSASVDVVYSAYGADVPAPSGAAFGTVTGNITTPDSTKNALIHFCMFRAYAKETEASVIALSAPNYTLFKQLLGDDVKTSLYVKPTITEKAA